MAFKRSQRRDPSSNQLLKDDLLYFIEKDIKKYLRVGHIIKAFEKKEQILRDLDPTRIENIKEQSNDEGNE